MIGPRIKKMPSKKICTGCDVLISKTLGGTPLFPTKRVVNYCSHKSLPTEVAFIKEFPYTPKWCPALKTKINQTLQPMKFEEWWEKKAPIINNALKNNHDYIKPFFKNAYMWGKAAGGKERERIKSQHLTSAMYSDGRKRCFNCGSTNLEYDGTCRDC